MRPRFPSRVGFDAHPKLLETRFALLIVLVFFFVHTGCTSCSSQPTQVKDQVPESGPPDTGNTIKARIRNDAALAASESRKAIGGIDLPAVPACVPSQDLGGLNAYDVVKVSVQSDGKAVVIAATLKNPPGNQPGNALSLFFDTDNDRKTGGEPMFAGSSGMEFQSDLAACVGGRNEYSPTDWHDCGSGQVDGKSVTARYTKADLAQFDGDNFKEVHAPSFDEDDNADQGSYAENVPIIGNVAHVTFKYSELMVQPGQTIRILVQRHCGLMGDNDSFFPEIQLTLK